MTQLDRIQGYGDINSRSSNSSSTFEPFFPGGEVSKWSPTFGKDYDHPHADQEDPDHNNSHHPKKSVLTIVKEKAQKLRQTFSQKKHSHDHNYVSTTPSWGVSLEDNENEEDEEEDAEHHLESPKYESELAPDWYKKTTMQNPRAALFVSEKNVLASSVNLGAPQSGNATNGDQTWSEGVSVENLMHSHEAEEEEIKAISQERSELAISPRRRTPVVIGVVEKVKETVNSLLRNEQSSKYTAPINSANTSISDMPTSPSHDLPISTNAHEVGEEEIYGRILQAN